MAWNEENDMSKMLELTKKQNIEARCRAAVDADGIELRQCKECGGAYGYPTKNTWAQSKLGPDQGLCPVCSGAYEDPEGFLEF